MSTSYTTGSASRSSRTNVWTPAQLGSRIFRTLILWQARSEQRWRLRDMSDRELADMGITRGDAFGESRKSFWQS